MAKNFTKPNPKAAVKPAETKAVAETIISEKNESALFKKIFIALAAVMLVVMVWMSFGAGNSGDEDQFHYPYSMQLYKYYTSMGKDTSYINQYKMEYSGYAFDGATGVIVKIFNIDNYMNARHAMNAVMGFLLILFAGLFAKLVGNWRAGILTMVLLFLSPQILGQSLNNPKDIPFAALVMMSVYYMAWFIKEYPKPSWKTLVKLGISIGATIGIRPGGFLMIAYFGFFVIMYLLYTHFIVKPKNYDSQVNSQNFKSILWRGLAVIGISSVLMFILWPFALKDPFNNIAYSFKMASHFEANLKQLYGGSMIWSNELPWFYTLKYILITSPIIVFIGALLYLFVAKKYKNGYFWGFVLFFCFVFPIFWIAYTKAILYGGWRHSLFVYAPLAILAGLGFTALASMMKNKYMKIGITALPFLFLVQPFIHIVANHPYEYIYFNQAFGGVKSAYGNYELDYYFHTTREASEWILKDAKAHPKKDGKIKVVSWHTESVKYFFRHDTADFQVGFCRWYEKGNTDWDYAVFTVTGINPALLKNKDAFPPKNTAHIIKVDGKPVCLVLKRTDKSDFEGYEAMKKNDIQTAIPLLQKALSIDPYNEQALENLITIYSNLNDMPKTYDLINQWIAIDRTNSTALFQLANYYFRTGDMANATAVGLSISKYNSLDFSGYWIAANAQFNLGDYQRTVDYINKIIQIKGDFKPAYQLLAQVYQKTGNMEQAQQVLNAIQQLP